MWVVNKYHHQTLFSTCRYELIVCACLWLQCTKKSIEQKQNYILPVPGARLYCVKLRYANPLHHTGTCAIPVLYLHSNITKYLYFIYNTSHTNNIITTFYHIFSTLKKNCSFYNNNYPIWKIFIIQNQSLMLWWSTNPWNIHLPKGFIDARDIDEPFTMWESNLLPEILSLH